MLHDLGPLSNCTSGLIGRHAVATGATGGEGRFHGVSSVAVRHRRLLHSLANFSRLSGSMFHVSEPITARIGWYNG
jgi:hypothetical protein